MAKTKAVSMTIRITSEAKYALFLASEHEHRSQANMIEYLIIDYCRRNEIPYPPTKEMVFEFFERQGLNPPSLPDSYPSTPLPTKSR